MQPLVYLAMRTLFGWLQFAERKERAFRRDSLVLVAVGALHCWAVAYALFISVHTRAMRYDGYQDDSFGEYTEHLPTSVSLAEKLTLSSIWIWLIAGFAMAVKSILEEEAGDLPLGCQDGQTGSVSKFLRSPSMSSLLALANTVACTGLFLGIMLLCISMAIMKGGITTCEVCLAALSFAFALPHACLALQRVSPELSSALSTVLPLETMQAAAAEAAAMAPQLCVVLSLADSPGHAYVWQNCLYAIAVLAAMAAAAACAAAPRLRDGAALPPEEPETFACLVLNAMSALVLVLSYPELNTWTVWLSIAMFVAGTFAGYPFWREFALDWLEPVFVVRSDTDKKMRADTRDNVRKASWLAALLCGAAAVWDIATIPPVTNPVAVEPDYLMLRWKAGQGRAPEKLLDEVAGALQLDAKSLLLQKADEDHRLIIFRHVPTGPMSRGESPVSDRWKSAAAAPLGALAETVERGFPHVLNASVCADESVFPPPPAENESAPPRVNDAHFGGSVGAHAAYEAACNWRAVEISRYLMTLRSIQQRLATDSTEYMVRWLPREQPTTGQDVISAAAGALGVEASALAVSQEFSEQRVVVFRHTAASQEKATEVPSRWRALSVAPLGGLKELLDTSFPTVFSFETCSDESIFPHPGDGKEAPASAVDDGKFGGARGAYLAYEAVCHWRRAQILKIHEAISRMGKENETDSGAQKGASADGGAEGGQAKQ